MKKVDRSSAKKGFYLVEIVVAIAVMAILGAIGFIRLETFRKEAILGASADEIVSVLTTAQGKTMAGEDNRRYQVHFTAASFSLLDEFGNLVETTNVSSLVQITPPPADIVFEKVDGASNGGAVGLALTDGSSSRTITVSAEGVISLSTP